jgi:aminoglycoside phosphotransferase (APT) family kinase protein
MVEFRQSDMNGPLDHEALETWLVNRLDAFSGPLSVERFNGGQSNPTFLLSTPANKYVLRKKPDGDLLSSAHAIDREYRVMRALSNTGVPVPRMLTYCEDTSVIGAPFFVMAHVEGRIFWDPTLPEVRREDRVALYADINRVVAALHSVDPASVGLGDFGRPGHFLQRQLARWTSNITRQKPNRSRRWIG